MRKHLVAALAACVTVAGCSSDPKTLGDTYSLTVFAYDAQTNAPIASADLAKGLVLFEGADKTQPVVLDSGVAGAVIFKDVPADYASGNKVYPIMANIAGYQPFQGEVSFAANTDSAQQDDLYAQIGYVYLWPVGFHAPDYTFTVVYNGKPVPNAVVEFLPPQDETLAAGNSQHHGVITKTFAGAIPALSGTTDANGKVTFAGTSLVLGATYDATVFPLVFGGVQLGEGTDSAEIGVDANDRLISMTAPLGLYVTNVTPLSGQIQTDGQLTITFNIPVATTSAFATAFSASPSGGITGGTLGAPSANAVLSPDGKTLTLTPNWTVQPTATAAGSYIAYSSTGGEIVVPAYPADAISVFADLSLLNGNAVSNTVTVKAP